MIRIQDEIITQIERNMTEQTPDEGCGYLAGSAEEICLFIPISNIASEPLKHFEFQKNEQFDAIRTIRDNGLQLMGVVHSHPNGIAYPSETDITLADEKLLQMIIVPNKNHTETRLFWIVDSTVTEVPYSII